MTGVAEIKLALDGLKAVANLAKSIGSIASTAERQIQLTKLNAEIAAAQQSVLAAALSEAAMLKRNQELEAEIAKFKAWEAEKERYELRYFEPGSYAYALKESAVQGGEPLHLICQPCCDAGRKGVLRWTKELQHRHRVFACPICKEGYALNYEPPLPSQTSYDTDYPVLG